MVYRLSTGLIIKVTFYYYDSQKLAFQKNHFKLSPLFGCLGLHLWEAIILLQTTGTIICVFV